MNRLLGKKLFSSVLAGLTAASLAACGGGSHSAALPPSTTGSNAASTPYNGPLADAIFRITIPGPKNSAFKRRPSYVSSATKSLQFKINTASALTAAQVTSYNALGWSKLDTGTLPTTACPASGSDFVCTVTLKLPPGTDDITVTAYDATGGTSGGGNILSQQRQVLTVATGTSNSFTMVLDANITTPNGSMVVSGNGFCSTGPVGTAFGSVGTTPVTFTVAYTDAQGKTIVATTIGSPSGPVMPKLAIQGNDSLYHTDSGTINATGGTVGFTITQNPPSFVLTPSTVPVSNATINVRATQADYNAATGGPADGLSFTKTKSYTFSAGTAPPAHNFLAGVEQLTASSGQVDLWNVSLGGNTAGSDTFSAYSPATLAVTASTNESGVNDVDNPQDLRWDVDGDLLIANGGGAPGDNGNMACVPQGAIATGANSSTTVSTNAFDPVSIAYDSRDGTVAMANNPTSAPKQLAEYVLSGNYTASTNNLTASGFGSHGTVEIPDLTAGTFAIGLTTGVGEDPASPGESGAHGNNKVAIFSPTGGETDIVDDTTYAIDKPWGLAYDSTNHQLVIANNSAFHKLLAFYTVSPVAQVKTINTTHKMTFVAASADGHIAVAWATSFGYNQVQVFDNTASRNPVFGPIPYNGVSAGCGGSATYIYGNGTTIVNSLRWLSNTKLLVAVQSNNSGTPTALNGFYVYDITNSAVPTGQDDVTCSTFAAAPINTGFVHVNNKPLGAAFKP